MSSSGSDAEFDDLEEGFWEKISYTWVIENIDSCLNDTVDRLRSPIFYNDMRDCTWQIQLSLPPKSVRSDMDYLGVFLRSVSFSTVHQVKFTLSIRASDDHVIETLSCGNCFTEESSSCGFDEMVRLSKLRRLSIHDNILKIRADLLTKVVHFDAEDNLTMTSFFAAARLQKSMNVLFESLQCTDVVFEVEGAELKAHKHILSARSPVFAAMFTQDSIEKHSGVVKIVDFETDVFRRFLHFVYSGKVSIPSVDAAAVLFRIAEKYDFPDLKVLCVKYMSTNLNSSNIGSILLLAETFRVTDLKQTVMNYVIENITDFRDIELEVYKLLEKENPQLLTELFVMLFEKFR